MNERLVKGMILGEDKRSIIITFEDDSTCTLGNIEMKLLSQLYREIVSDYHCPSGNCGPTGWRPV